MDKNNIDGENVVKKKSNKKKFVTFYELNYLSVISVDYIILNRTKNKIKGRQGKFKWNHCGDKKKLICFFKELQAMQLWECKWGCI